MALVVVKNPVAPFKTSTILINPQEQFRPSKGINRCYLGNTYNKYETNGIMYDYVSVKTDAYCQSNSNKKKTNSCVE